MDTVSMLITNVQFPQIATQKGASHSLHVFLLKIEDSITEKEPWRE